MDYARLKQLQKKLYFTVRDLADTLGIKIESARVLASRYTKDGIFIRLKNNFYVLEQKWAGLAQEDFFMLSNYLQVPSYISLTSALWFYEITTQVPRNFFESISLKRSQKFNIKGASFLYYKVKKEFYGDFIRRGNFFIAAREKAFIDAVYLYSFGKYKLDFSSLDTAKLDKRRLKQIIKKYPDKTKQIVRKICGI